MRIFVIIILFSIGGFTYGQQLHHEMISSQGGSSVTSGGYQVRYTVGQQSVAGTSASGYVVQLGVFNKVIGVD